MTSSGSRCSAAAVLLTSPRKRSSTLASAPPSGFVRVDMLRTSSAHSTRAWPPVACRRRSGERSAFMTTSFFSAATFRASVRKNVLPDPYSPMTKRTVDPPWAMRVMSSTVSPTSRARPTCTWRMPRRGTTPARKAWMTASRSLGGIGLDIVGSTPALAVGTRQSFCHRGFGP